MWKETCSFETDAQNLDNARFVGNPDKSLLLRQQYNLNFRTAFSWNKTGVGMATRKMIALRLIVIVAIVFAALFFVAPVFLNIDRYRPRIISYFEESTGKKWKSSAWR